VISESCDATCDRASGNDGTIECDAGWLDVVNSCHVMRAAFPEVISDLCIRLSVHTKDASLFISLADISGGRL
jgi:hypothetical protein